MIGSKDNNAETFAKLMLKQALKLTQAALQMYG